MEVKVNAVHFTADAKLVDFVNNKVSKLDTYFDKIISSEVFLKLDKASDNENKVAEVKILMPGKELFAKKQCKSFEEAADLAVDALKKQIKKHKEKLQS
jgi:putative sigma-54 modulation protein